MNGLGNEKEDTPVSSFLEKMRNLYLIMSWVAEDAYFNINFTGIKTGII
jgi:hypothetical protein